MGVLSRLQLRGSLQSCTRGSIRLVPCTLIWSRRRWSFQIGVQKAFLLKLKRKPSMDGNFGDYSLFALACNWHIWRQWSHYWTLTMGWLDIFWFCWHPNMFTRLMLRDGGNWGNKPTEWKLFRRCCCHI